MKFAYLDEAGVGGEPWVVVAGVIIEPDLQWADLRQYLNDMADHYLLPEDRDGCIFHAKDIFSGSHRFHKDRYTLDIRKEILKELCRIPSAAGITVVGGVVDLLKYESSQTGKTRGQIITEAHCISYATCVCNIDQFLKGYGNPGEMATLVVEDNTNARKHIKATQGFLNSDEFAEYLADHPMGKFLPVTRIVDVPHFVEKADSPIMQLADACAFVMMRHCCGLPHVKEYVDLIRPALWNISETDDPPKATRQSGA